MGGDSLIWADVGEILGLEVEEIREIDRQFKDYLNLESKEIPASMLPVISFIANSYREGLTVSEIIEKLEGAKDEDSWPDDILSRMTKETAATGAIQVEHEPLFEILSDDPERVVWRKMIVDLRYEMEHLATVEREILHRINFNLQRLAQEIRELRYAILISSSRKSRKKGKRSTSSLL